MNNIAVLFLIPFAAIAYTRVLSSGGGLLQPLMAWAMDNIQDKIIYKPLFSCAQCFAGFVTLFAMPILMDWLWSLSIHLGFFLLLIVTGFFSRNAYYVGLVWCFVIPLISFNYGMLSTNVDMNELLSLEIKWVITCLFNVFSTWIFNVFMSASIKIVNQKARQ